MAEAWLVYQPKTGQLYYQVGEKAYSATTLREIPLPPEFGVPILRIYGDQKWTRQPVFVLTTNGWSVENSIDNYAFGIIKQSSPDVINQQVVDFRIFQIPILTHADGSESLIPVPYEVRFSSYLAAILKYLKDHQLPAIYDNSCSSRSRRTITNSTSQGCRIVWIRSSKERSILELGTFGIEDTEEVDFR